MSAQEQLMYELPGLYGYVRDDQQYQSREFVKNVTRGLADVYDEEHRTEAVSSWEDWSNQVVEPFRTTAIEKQISVPVKFENKGLTTNARVVLNFLGDFRRVQEALALTKKVSGIVQGSETDIEDPSDYDASFAQRLGALSVKKDIRQVGPRLLGRPIFAPKIIERKSINTQELTSVAANRLMVARQESEIEGVQFKLEGTRRYGQYSHETLVLAEGSVVDPNASVIPVWKRDSLPNPYKELLRRDKFWPIARVANRLGMPIEGQKAATTTKVVQRLVRLAAVNEAAKAKRQQVMAERVLELLLDSEYYQELTAA